MKKLFTTLVAFSILACQAAVAQTYDPAITGVISPVSGCALSANTPFTITLNNFGNSEVIGIWLGYDYTYSDGVNPPAPFVGAYEWFDDEIEPNTPQNYTFVNDPINLSAPGVYVITVYISPFGPGELNLANNTLVFTVINYGQPIVVTHANPYLETFEGTGHNWSAGGTNSSWALGMPAGSVIQGSYGGGTKSWATNLTGPHNNNEASYVQSPCFDLSALIDPYIQMPVWWNSQLNQDGTVLLYSTDGGATWERIGNGGDSVNWYNNTTVAGLNAVSGQTHGWSGIGASASGGWVIARHDLRRQNGISLGGAPQVQFRVAFGSNATTVFDGFAFDNVLIRDKPQKDLALLGMVPFPQSCGLSSTESVSVYIYNNSTTPQSTGSFALSYTIDGNPVATNVPYIGPTIQPFTTVAYTFPITTNLSTAPQYAFTAWLTLTGDENVNNNTISTTIFNSVVPENYGIDFENGPASLSQFSITTRPRSDILVNAAGAQQGNFGMIMHGHTQGLGWSDLDALTNPWGPNSNTERFSQAVICVQTPADLGTMKLSFYLKQLYYQNYLWTNFRLTVNGQPIPFTRDGVPFVPSSVNNNQALRPPTVPNATTNAWQHIEADLTPYLDTANASIQIGFESSVRYTYNQTAAAGTANLLDSITVVSTVLDCNVTPYHPNCPCGQIPPDPTCCPDPNNPNCPPVDCAVTPYDPECPCGPVQFVAADCCPDPNNPLCVPLDCAVTPYDPACPCGPVLFVAADCCPDPNNPLCPIVDCSVTPYDPECPCGPVLFVFDDCCPDPNNLLCDTLSVPGQVNVGSIKLFPNPTNGVMAIDLTSLDTDLYTIEVMDVTGKIALREVVLLQNQPTHTIDLSKQPKGIYFVKVSSDTRVYTGKIALQ